MKKVKKVVSLAIAFVLVLAMSIPVFALPQIGPSPSTPITRDEYRAFDGTRHTSNNATRPIAEGITFVADNNVHNQWYIRVDSDATTGSITVAYQIGSRHYMRTIAIAGAGRYVIGDSRGRDGLNEITLGAFAGTSQPGNNQPGGNQPETNQPQQPDVGACSQITRDQYNNFGGTRHTSNNATRPIAEGITFVADNNNLNSWYIYVTGDVSGSIAVAYQIGSRHYTCTIEISGPGRHIIGDSRGPNGLNEIRLGDFVPANAQQPPDDGDPSDDNDTDNDNDNDLGYTDNDNDNDNEDDPIPRLALHGFEPEQDFAYELTGLIPPTINSVQYEVLCFIRGIYRITISVDDCTLDPRALPVFFWQSAFGTFSDIVYWQQDYASFTFHANPGTEGLNINLIVGVSDNLGQVARRAVVLRRTDVPERNAVNFTPFVSAIMPLVNGVNFPDVPASHWAHSTIYNMVNSGAITGFVDGTFRPNDIATIEFFTVLTLRVAGIDPPSGAGDVLWSDHYINYAMVNGFLPPSIDIHEEITREFAFYIMYNILNSDSVVNWNRLRDAGLYTADAMPFVDAYQIASQFSNATQILFQHGIVPGFFDGTVRTVRPQCNLTRAEMAALLFRAITPIAEMMEVCDAPIYLCVLTGLRFWSTGSMEITLWYGQLDHISNVKSPGLNVQGAAGTNVFAMADAVVAGVYEDRVYVSFRLNGDYIRAVYGNIAPRSGLAAGHYIRRGEIIGQMGEHMDRGVLELIILRSTDGINFETINPTMLFDLSEMMSDFLHHPMANFFARNANQNIDPQLTSTEYADLRFALNLDLEEGEIYLRRLVEYLFYSSGLQKEGLTIDDVLHWCEDTQTATLTMFGETIYFVPYEVYEMQRVATPFVAFSAVHVIPFRFENDRAVTRVAGHHYAQFMSGDLLDKAVHITNYDEMDPFEPGRVYRRTWIIVGGDTGGTRTCYFAAQNGYVFEQTRRAILHNVGTLEVRYVRMYRRAYGFAIEYRINDWGDVFRLRTYALCPNATVRLYAYEGRTMQTTIDRIRASGEDMPRVMINAGFFYDPTNAPSYWNMGWHFSYGNMRMLDNSRVIGSDSNRFHYFNTLIYFKDGSSKVARTAPLSRAQVRAYANNAIFIISGTIDAPGRYGRWEDRQPRIRSMIGIRPDGSVIFLTAEGVINRAYHGITVRAGEAILREMGAVSVLNLDGGGSTQFIIYGEPEIITSRRIGSVFKAW